MQKGTLSGIIPRENLPYTSNGIVADILMNTLALPSRMTIAQLIECLNGKKMITSHKFNNLTVEDIFNSQKTPLSRYSDFKFDGDATPFRKFDLNAIAKELVKCGMNGWGNETVYDGITGRKWECLTFIGPVYYQRLKHMTVDKIHCLTMDHEVLTKKGWKSFKDLTMNDYIASMKDGCLRYDKPNKLLYYPNFMGKLYHIKTQQIDLKVTMDHRMLVSNINSKEVKEKEVKEKYTLQKIQNIFKQDMKYKKNVHSKIYKESKTDEYIKQYIYNKSYFPEWVLKLSQRQSIILIELLSNKFGEVFTTFKLFCDQFMILCLNAGWSANIYKCPNTFMVRVIKKNPVVNKKYNTIIKCYKGPVFCLEMPFETFYVRRNGKGVWTGNSRDRGPKQTLTRQPTEGRNKDGGFRIGVMEKDGIGSLGCSGIEDDRMTEQSDIYFQWRCNICGLPAIHNNYTNKVYCNVCESDDASRIKIPYGTKNVTQTLLGMNTATRILTTPYE